MTRLSCISCTLSIRSSSSHRIVASTLFGHFYNCNFKKPGWFIKPSYWRLGQQVATEKTNVGVAPAWLLVAVFCESCRFDKLSLICKALIESASITLTFREPMTMHEVESLCVVVLRLGGTQAWERAQKCRVESHTTFFKLQ